MQILETICVQQISNTTHGGVKIDQCFAEKVKNFCPHFDFTVKALMVSHSLCHRNFQMKTDLNVKIGSCTRFYKRNKILASKIRNLKQQKISISARVISKRWIEEILVDF